MGILDVERDSAGREAGDRPAAGCSHLELAIQLLRELEARTPDIGARPEEA